METTNPSLVAGVFRDQADVDRAIQELKHVGFREDQIRSTLYNLKTEGIPETSRLVVTIMAEDRNQEAASIFVNNGANNTDLPAGTVLKQGTLVSSSSTPEPGNASSE